VQARRPIRLEGGVNGRKLALVYGLLRNSTKIATQFSGLGQCSQKDPYWRVFVKHGLRFGHPYRDTALYLQLNLLTLFSDGLLAGGCLLQHVRSQVVGVV
jgi:hypothetical protein